MALKSNGTRQQTLNIVQNRLELYNMHHNVRPKENWSIQRMFTFPDETMYPQEIPTNQYKALLTNNIIKKAGGQSQKSKLNLTEKQKSVQSFWSCLDH